MTEIKTEKQLTIELRNEVAGRIISARASEVYWRLVAKKEKNNSQEKIDAFDKVKINEQSIAKDEKYLKVIDEMLKE